MAARKTAKKTARRRTNSKIQDAQKSTFERREQDKKRREEAIAKEQAAKKRTGTSTGPLGNTQMGPAQPGTTRMQRSESKESSSSAALKNIQNIDPNSLAEANEKIAGIAAAVRASAIAQKKRTLADSKMYGISDRNIQARLAALKNAQDETRQRALKEKGNAVYMGQVDSKIRNRLPGDGGDFEGGQYRIPEKVAIDNVVGKDDLLAWLSDPKKVEYIKTMAQKAGLDVESYEDIGKLWESVVKQAAQTFSVTGKKVTPWALMQLRGKYAVGGRMQDKVTTSTSIEEMDPAQARLMFEETTSKFLGRAPTKAEIDDFIAKAQTIAKANPRISTTTSRVGFDGEIEQGSQMTVSRGGQEVVNAQSELAARDMAKDSEEYGSFQAAGTYMPLLFEALQSPV